MQQNDEREQFNYCIDPARFDGVSRFLSKYAEKSARNTFFAWIRCILDILLSGIQGHIL